MNRRPSSHAHVLIKETAEAMAHELYDTVMQNDFWYRYWKELHPEMDAKQLEEEFVKHNTGKLLPDARAALAKILAVSNDEAMKETIYEALLLDNTLLKGR